MLDISTWPEFLKALREHQRTVEQTFAELFTDLPQTPQPEINSRPDTQSLAGPDTPGSAAWWQAVGIEECEPAELVWRLQAAGYQPTERIIDVLVALVRGPFFERLTAIAQERVERLLPQILALAQAVARDEVEATEALQHSLAWLRAVAGRSGYLQVLLERPDALARLVRLFSQSGWVARFLLHHPILIDELLQAQSFRVWTAEDAQQEATALLARLTETDLEEQMDRVRNWRQAREFAIAVAELDGELPLMKVSDQLSWLAEAVIEVVLALCWRSQVERFGKPCYVVDGVSHDASVGVVAYGKLGGLELGHGADLDLVFMHDSWGEKQLTNGEKSIENAVFFARLLQKFVHFMTTMTPAGLLYEIDLRLRPNGASGVLVTSIQNFNDYQQKNAWPWEHQALVRARMVHGTEAIRAEFVATRQAVLARPRIASKLRGEVVDMRRRMREHLANEQAEQMHLKQDSGGITDIEFMVQFVVLLEASKHPELLEFTDNIRIIEQSESLDLITPQLAVGLRDAYIELRQRQHRQALQEASAVVQIDERLQLLRDRVAAIWTEMMEDASTKLLH